MSQPGLELPELTQSILDREQLDALFRDIAALTQIGEIIPKHGPREHVDDSIPLTLDAAHEGLLEGAFRGVQIRYIHEGSLWWDTLLRTPEGGFTIVRIRHDIEGEVAQPV